MEAKKPVKIVVIGAGIIGMSTAYRLLKEVPHLKVTVVAEKFSPDNTSDGAAGIWGPHGAFETPRCLLRSWSERTLEYAMNLIHYEAEAHNHGVFTCHAVALSADKSGELPWWSDMVDHFHVLTEKELSRYPLNQKSGYSHTAVVIEGARYVPMLTNKFRDLGGEVKQQKVENFSELQEFDVIVNCSGLGSKDLLQDDVFPIRGHLVRVKAPWVRSYLSYFETDHVTFMVPNTDTVVIGGTFEVGNDSKEIDMNDKQRALMMKEAKVLSPGLEHAEYITDWVGHRPGRKTVRLGKEDLYLEKINKTVKMVHNYGHGGCGITLHWGCAEDAVKLVLESLNESKKSSN